MDILKEYGYSIDYKKMEETLHEFSHRAVCPNMFRYYEQICLFSVLAYEAGASGRILSDLIPFLKKEVSA